MIIEYSLLAAGKSAFPTVFSPDQPFAPSGFPAAAAAAAVQPVQQGEISLLINALFLYLSFSTA